ncbi:snRNA-activating protein complex subunit 4 [Araneus ventricosus]|uniref:snRNA-activating protein complex subunit 4 n=1 Tax=Araneus ventricosus TaxID=182803 RepID=A0A4Y2AXH8_ARAVE|nr:snRNA-activating protein complex subunit 4 [Araneus ventricosus]
MTEANESLSVKDFLALFQFPFHEYVSDINEGIVEYLSDRPGTSQISAVNSGNQNVGGDNLEEFDEYLSDQVGILHSSDVSTDSESLSDENEGDISECSSVDTGLSDISIGNSDISDFPPEDFEIELKAFPDDPKLLKSSLSANRKLQKKLSEALEKIKNTLDEKEAQMKKFHKAKDDEIARRAWREPMLKTRAAFLSPYFAEPGPIGMFPPSNEDTIAKLRNNEIIAYDHPPRTWSSFDKAQLLKGVYEVAFDYVLKPYTRRLEFLQDKIKDKRKDKTLIKYQEIEMKEEIKRIKYTIKQKCKKSTEEIIKEAGDNIDWMRISAQFFEGLRSEEDCELMWNNCLSIFVNKKRFSTAEDRKLEKLVKKYREKNWDLIAKELQTGRTAIQCCIRYHRHLNKNIAKKGLWSAEEDAKLLRVVEELRIGDYIPWLQVHLYIEGRTNDQISKHYRIAAEKSLDKSPWTKEEDALILACAKKFSTKNWTKIEKYLPNRTYQNIKNRYVWFLNPTMKIGPWSDEEHFKLIELVKKHGFGKWTLIARQLPGRPSAAIRRHINTLIIRDQNTKEIRFKSPEEIKEMSKLVSVNNFVTACWKRRKDIVDSAYETLKSALEKISYDLKEPITLDNLSLISYPGLRLLQKELLKRKKKSVRWNINTGGKTRFSASRPVFNDNKSMSNSEDETDVDLGGNEIESNWMNPEVRVQKLSTNNKETKELEEDEKAWLQKVLHSKIEEEVNRAPIPSYISRIIDKLGLCSTLEYSMYEEYLQQQMMHCKASNKEEDDNLYFMNGRNYKTSMPEVIHRFVHPRGSDDQVLVLPPNCTTLDAMNAILASDSMLRKAADLVDHSVAYLRYLFDLTKKRPKCVKCSLAGKVNTSYEDYKTALDNMKSRLVVPTEEMKKSAMVETVFPAYQLKECWCDELVESKATVDLLTKRFITLFLWPYFLQSVEPTKQQLELLLRTGCYKYKLKKPPNQSQRGKRKCESEDEGCSKKKCTREDSEDTEAEEENYESDRLSCSSPTTTVQGSPSQSHAAQNKTEDVEVVCLSDTPEDFCYAEPME